MPYINQKQRHTLRALIFAIEGSPGLVLCHKGPINYIITKLLKHWLGKNPGYAAINDAIGILECVKLELYRRVAVPYENKKKRENSDVY